MSLCNPDTDVDSTSCRRTFPLSYDIPCSYAFLPFSSTTPNTKDIENEKLVPTEYEVVCQIIIRTTMIKENNYYFIFFNVLHRIQVLQIPLKDDDNDNNVLH